MWCCSHLQPLFRDGPLISYPATIPQLIEVFIISAIILGMIGLIFAAYHYGGNGGDSLTLCHPIYSATTVNNKVLHNYKFIYQQKPELELYKEVCEWYFFSSEHIVLHKKCWSLNVTYHIFTTTNKTMHMKSIPHILPLIWTPPLQCVYYWCARRLNFRFWGIGLKNTFTRSCTTLFLIYITNFLYLPLFLIIG